MYFCVVLCIVCFVTYSVFLISNFNLLAFEDGTECSVPKHWHIKFRRREITQKKTYNVLCIVCVYVCTALLPPGDYPVAVKCIISYISPF